MSATALEAALSEVLGGEVAGLRRLSGGASRETWSFDWAREGGPREQLIVQRERTRGASTVSNMEREAALLAAAGEAGVPVAPLVASGGADSPLGASFTVTRWLPGETLGPRLVRDDAYADVRPRMVGACARALAGIHRIPLDAVSGLEEPDPVQQFRDILDFAVEPHPAFELAFRWLAANPVAPAGRTVVHGDFRTGNLLVSEERLEAVLDWELAHIGDPVEDLGWLCVRAWRFGSDQPVGGFGSYEELLARYGEASGRSISAEQLRWWEVYGTLRWGVICIMQARTHLDGLSRSVELAAIGRRVCENEWDLLELLVPDQAGTDRQVDAAAGSGGPERTVPDGFDPGPHDRPTALELLDAVREFLERDVMDGAEGRLRFHARVARNVVEIVERELRLGPAQAAGHRRRLARLGFADDGELAAAIRAGDVDARLTEIAAAVRASVRDKLAVANPRYLGQPTVAP